MPAIFAHLFYGGLDGAAEKLAVILIPVVLTLSSLPPDLISNLVPRLLFLLF
ncbi:MAG TPA: hypothetical protein ACHBZ9_04100 [Arsenophonus nasoniae]|uniref:hypothetical protein n=1 Tax=Arsenophonus nasoniae TaxID=638 RepID=UPI00387A69D3